jgi:voltage-gated potassium channel
VLLFAGVGMLGSITGKFASMFILHREKRMPRDLEDHIILINWNSRAEALIRELHSPEAVPDADLVVITDKKDGDILRLIREEDEDGSPFKCVSCCPGSPLNSEIMAKARPERAQAIVILAQDGITDPDAQSALIALVVRSLIEEKKDAEQSGPHIIAESIDPRKRQLLKSAGIHEIICSSQYGLGVLAQCCLHHNISQVYDRILHFTEDTSEMYVAAGDRLPKNTTNHSYREICVAILKQQDTQNPVTPIGIQRKNGECLLNPKNDDQEIKLEEGDGIIVIALTKPDLSGVDCSRD